MISEEYLKLCLYLHKKLTLMEKIFDNTQVAFSLKSDTELDRAYFLFK